MPLLRAVVRAGRLRVRKTLPPSAHPATGQGSSIALGGKTQASFSASAPEAATKNRSFGQTQPAAVNELDRNTVSPQADVTQQSVDFRAGEHRRQSVMIARADLREHIPLRRDAEQLMEKEPQTSHSLPDTLEYRF